MWAEKDEVDKIRSGIEEPYSEKDILLQEVSSMCMEFNFPEKKKQRQSKDKQILKLGKEARNKCAEALCPSPQHQAEENVMNDHNYVVFEVGDDEVCEVHTSEILNVEIDSHNLENTLPVYENEQTTTVVTTPIKNDLKQNSGNTITKTERSKSVAGIYNFTVLQLIYVKYNVLQENELMLELLCEKMLYHT
ncbi:hypothetical protein JTB14_038323 [Gonioctena quinquepunctata]|nr:hypothetical protein JTB14_038323 [Gonioctena quinquepunctata]